MHLQQEGEREEGGGREREREREREIRGREREREEEEEGERENCFFAECMRKNGGFTLSTIAQMHYLNLIMLLQNDRK